MRQYAYLLWKKTEIGTCNLVLFLVTFLLVNQQKPLCEEEDIAECMAVQSPVLGFVSFLLLAHCISLP